MTSMTMLKTAAVAGALTVASLTGASAATTVTANENYISVGGVVNAPNGSYQYDYVAGEDVTIDEFALSAVGNTESDIESIQASFVPTTGETVVLEAISNGSSSVAFGGGFLSGLSLMAGESFSILFEVISGGMLASNVGVQVAFDTVDVAPVPVPAAGGLLVTALGAAGFAFRRRSKTA